MSDRCLCIAQSLTQARFIQILPIAYIEGLHRPSDGYGFADLNSLPIAPTGCGAEPGKFDTADFVGVAWAVRRSCEGEQK